MSDLINRQDAIDGFYEMASNTDYLCTVSDYVKFLESMTSAEIVFCKDCTHFHYDFWADVNGIPLIVGHEMCDFWGEGCKTKEGAFCSFAERRIDG